MVTTAEARVRGRMFSTAALMLAIEAAACAQGDPKTEPAPLAAETPLAAAAAAPDSSLEGERLPSPSLPAPAEGVVSGSTPAVAEFGVPECDKYVRKYLACVEGHVSGAEKEKLIAAFEANLTKWRALAMMREGKIAMALSCRTATAASRDALVVDYGCEF